MKQLKDILKESLLDDADDILNDSVKELIVKFLEDNYDIDDYKISDKPDKDGKYIVNCKSASVKNIEIKALTNRFFKFVIIDGHFNCSHCNSLTSLEGAPKEVGGRFNCSRCKLLKTLDGAPKKVRRGFYCSGCESLISLKGTPEKVNGDFYCANCKSLKTLEGAPKEVGGDFYCNGCPIKFDIEDIKKYSKIKGKIIV